MVAASTSVIPRNVTQLAGTKLRILCGIVTTSDVFGLARTLRVFT